jgi:aryl-alcohol dehydrogenase-like predicted oxidoreductase
MPSKPALKDFRLAASTSIKFTEMIQSHQIDPLLESEKVGLLVWGPLAGGLLSGKFTRHNQKLENSRRSVQGFPIVNKERAWNIIDVMGAIAKDEVSQLPPEYPEWMLATQGADRLGPVDLWSK